MNIGDKKNPVLNLSDKMPFSPGQYRCLFPIDNFFTTRYMYLD